MFSFGKTRVFPVESSIPMPAATLRMTTPASSPESEPEASSWLQVVERKVAALRFGSVQIVVHEGRVTQIESTEKFRFQPRSASEASPRESE